MIRGMETSLKKWHKYTDHKGKRKNQFLSVSGIKLRCYDRKSTLRYNSQSKAGLPPSLYISTVQQTVMPMYSFSPLSTRSTKNRE